MFRFKGECERGLRGLVGMGAGLLLLAGLCGCVQTRTSQPSRTAVEQLLLSHAADRSLAEMDLSSVNGRKVYVDEKYFDSTDKMYALGAVREAISKAGGQLQEARADAEVIVEARSGALSIDNSSALVGFPELPVPIPFVGTFKSPELPFYKETRQYSLAKLALFGYEAESRNFVFATTPTAGKSQHHYFTFFGYINWTSTELPEKQSELGKKVRFGQGH